MHTRQVTSVHSIWPDPHTHGKDSTPTPVSFSPNSPSICLSCRALLPARTLHHKETTSHDLGSLQASSCSSSLLSNQFSCLPILTLLRDILHLDSTLGNLASENLQATAYTLDNPIHLLLSITVCIFGTFFLDQALSLWNPMFLWAVHCISCLHGPTQFTSAFPTPILMLPASRSTVFCNVSHY